MPSRCANTGTRASACTRATETLAAPWHNDVDAAVEAGEHRTDGSAIADRHQRNRRLRQVRGGKALGESGMDRGIGMMRLGAAAQDRSIAGLEAQRAGIGGDVRTALVDDAHDAQRDAHPFDGHSIWPRPTLGDGTDRIGERAHHIETICYARDPPGVECQPVEERGRCAAGFGLGEILRVGGKDGARVGANGSCHRCQRSVFLVPRCEREHPRGRPRLPPEFGHDGVDRRFDRFERYGHAQW